MNKKTFVLALVWVLALSVFWGERTVYAETGERKTLRMATEGTMYPWTFVEDGKVVGYEADMMQEIEKRTGIGLEMQIMDWSGIFGALDSGRVDSIANIITITEARKEKYVFTQPYVYNKMVLATRSDSDIQSMDDINGRTIVIEIGSSDEMVLKQLENDFGVRLKPVYYEGISITDVENGRVDLWIGGEASLKASIAKAEYKLKIVGATGAYQEYGYPFPKNREGEALREQFDRAISEMKQDGTLSRISKKWLDLDVTQGASK